MNNPFNNFPINTMGPNSGKPFGFVNPINNTISPFNGPMSRCVDIMHNLHDNTTFISDNFGYSWKPIDIHKNNFPF
jgi:hypothetical protein